ncbi:LysR family transcriptional regulator [Microbacterium protaetiae]|uniref:LysR family transcriptional regulator n=1 Tax=Microbacterium protaetiae TaxID=2509458 RepID=A0A4P6EBC2_9MICO|nr:LysR family transcriptional regulator [Microbacterium protaetiae]QAY59460.1 LysR family transcriptional regulator [Microbacterium protaetiae]
MDTRQAEYAIAVAEELNFTRAARRVFAVQSTVSAGVRALEKELGADIFDRDQGGVRLTAAGEEIIPRLREFLDAGTRALTAADPQGSLRGELRVGVFANFGPFDLPRIIGDFHHAHPLVDLRLRSSPIGSAGFAEDVSRGRLDVALFGLPATAAPGLTMHPLATSTFVALLPTDHARAGDRHVPIAALADERFIDTPAGFGNRTVLDAALGRHGIVRDIATEIGETGLIPSFVAAGLGVAILPEMFAGDVPGVVKVPLDVQIGWELTAITRPQPTAAASAFVARLVPPA